jgi:hypothetical protein
MLAVTTKNLVISALVVLTIAVAALWVLSFTDFP